MFVRIVRIKALLTQPTEESTAHSANHFVATIWFLKEKIITLRIGPEWACSLRKWPGNRHVTSIWKITSRQLTEKNIFV
jgi:hypothetical protein